MKNEANLILIKSAKIIDPKSDYNQKVMDILISEDLIIDISPTISNDRAEIIDIPDLHISPGWVDLRANFRDPGNEDWEDLESGIRAAIRAGFTSVVLSPATNPVVDNKSTVEYLLATTDDSPVNIYPCAAFTQKLEGKELSEIYDMEAAGAIAFSNGKKSVDNAAVMNLALQYSKELNTPLMVHPQDNSISAGGQMNEGLNSTYVGLKGSPALAEKLAVLRDLELAHYAETKIHFSGISSLESIDVLSKTKAQFSADVSMHHLHFTDDDLLDYNTNLKSNSPIRSKEDRLALIKALKTNVISIICSDHEPLDIEHKNCEFDLADCGIAGIEAFFGVVRKNTLENLSLEELIEKIAINPRKLLGIHDLKIELNGLAELSLFLPNKKWTFQKEHQESKAYNNPYIGQDLIGQAVGIINKNCVITFDS